MMVQFMLEAHDYDPVLCLSVISITHGNGNGERNMNV